MNRLAYVRFLCCQFLFLLLSVGLLGCQTGETPVVDVTPAPTVTPLPVATAVPTAQPIAQDAEVDYCLNCHSSAARLQNALADSAAPQPAAGALALIYGQSGQSSARQRWEQLYVDGGRYPQTVHGQIACVDCHGGVQVADMATAHSGMLARPSEQYVATCGDCHANITNTYANSLHHTAAGFSTALDTRAHSADRVALMTALDATCEGCAATCGDCHVSTAPAGGGGLIEGHLFRAEPAVAPQCTACHGAMAAGEYLGTHGNPADVHYAQGGLTCTDCHTSHDMHGQLDNCQSCHQGPAPAQSAPADHPYSGSQSPSCESCHVPAATASDDNIWHAQHGADLSCQTCHALPYDNCTSCHIEADGTLTVSGAAGVMIGQNPLRSFARPYDYVTLRHVPITPQTFDSYGSGLLTYFDRLETWRYATPHTIQTRTPQTQTCFGCHGNEALFLTADKLAPFEVDANADVIVPAIPQAIEP